MKIEGQKVVSLSYILRSGGHEGDVVEEVKGDSPMVYLSRSGGLIEEFENNLEGLEVGNDFQFAIKSENAYGASNPDMIVDLPKSTFEVDGKLVEELMQVGRMVPMQDQNGNPLNGTIAEIADETVKIDFNHPMADQDLFFTGSVVDVREATEEEVSHGHVHGPGGVEH